MGKDKLRKFRENKTFDHVIEPHVAEFVAVDHPLKGKWNSDFFKNNKPIVLELGCGKGEYTVGLAQMHPDKNFIGVDIKGARIWRGAKTSKELGLTNVGFLRTHIDLINSFFIKDEIDEIWITFPDPQMKKRRARKRLTSTTFLGYYQKMLKHNGIINLKTDSTFLYEYTSELLKKNDIDAIQQTDNLYAENWVNDFLSIKTHYEQLHIDDGDNINYVSFALDQNQTLKEPVYPKDE